MSAIFKSAELNQLIYIDRENLVNKLVIIQIILIILTIIIVIK